MQASPVRAGLYQALIKRTWEEEESYLINLKRQVQFSVAWRGDAGQPSGMESEGALLIHRLVGQ
jgi:hypothetical protein